MAETAFVHEDFLRKIAALKRLAEKAGTPEEAAAAAAMAAKLMRDHDIAEVDVAGWAPDDLGAYINHEGVVVKTSWRQVLFTAIVRANGCRVIRHHDPNDKAHRPWLYRTVGKQANIDAVLDQYEFLATIVDKLSRSHYIDYALTANAHGMQIENESNWRHAFRCGAADTISRRLIDSITKQAEENVKVSNALIVLDKRVGLAVKKFYPTLGAIKQKQGMSNYNAYGAGKVAGRGVGLNRTKNIG